ncbi:hypothetical protein Ocin01_12215 [Orchesella cincta]|uniref:Uncharacterized protein n=1 Tax=Orchesella cincta TaxID=48709 RepID=A0A1D2MN39_ORCCI|nr:hypothetical protein Ocin01_12215 [Orchesella cincta]
MASKRSKRRRVLYPLAMQNDTNIVKEMLQGSSLNPDQDLKKICIRVRYSEEGKEASVVGYHNMTSQFKCSPTGNGKEWSFDCQHQSGKEDFSHKMYVTLTDNKTFAFVIRCWKNGLRGWTVFSTRKELHEDSHFHILEHAKSQGNTQSNVAEVLSDNLVNSLTDGSEPQTPNAHSQDITGLQNESNPTSSTQQTFSSNATSMDIDTSAPWELDILIANEFISESGFISPDPLRLGFDPFAPVTLGSDVPLTDPSLWNPLLPDTTDATLTGPTSGGNFSNNDLDPALEHFVLESLDTIAQAIGYRRPFVQEPMEEGANSAEHCTHGSPNIEHPPIYSPVQPEFADMEWDDNAFSDIDTSSIYSGNVDFPTWGTSSYSQDEFETDSQ